MKLTKKFNLVVTNSANGVIKIDDLLLDGNHSNLVIINKSLQNKSDPEFIKILNEITENQKHSLQKVNLHNCNYITHTEVLGQKLNLFCDFIKEVEITDCLLNNSEDFKNQNWSNLGSLRIYNSSADFLLFFEDSNVSLCFLKLMTQRRTQDDLDPLQKNLNRSKSKTQNYLEGVQTILGPLL